jgi:uncharacterized protein (DUF697 family)
MSRKLPKAIARTIDDLRSSAATARAEAARPAKAVAARATAPEPAAVEPEPEAVPPPPAKAPAPKADAPSPAPAPSAAAKKKPTSQPARMPVPVSHQPETTGHEAALRHAQARTIVEKHVTYSAAGGLIPIPIADVAGVTAIIVHMAGSLARHYKIPPDRNRTRALVLGLIGAMAPVGLGALTSSSLLRFIPGANLVGMAVTSIAAAACTRSIGFIFIEHFESGGTLLDFDPDSYKASLAVRREGANASRS